MWLCELFEELGSLYSHLWGCHDWMDHTAPYWCVSSTQYIDPNKNIWNLKPWYAMIMSTPKIKHLLFASLIFFSSQVPTPSEMVLTISSFFSPTLLYFAKATSSHPTIIPTSLSLEALKLCTVLPAPVERKVSTNFPPRKGCKATEMRLSNIQQSESPRKTHWHVTSLEYLISCNVYLLTFGLFLW